MPGFDPLRKQLKGKKALTEIIRGRRGACAVVANVSSMTAGAILDGPATLPPDAGSGLEALNQVSRALTRP